MKIIYVMAIAILLTACTSQKPKIAGKDFTSPINLAIKFYDLSRDEIKVLQDKEIIFENGVRELQHQWCMNSNFSSDQLSGLMKENCLAKGGDFIQEKFCVSKNNNLLKFIVEINGSKNPSSNNYKKDCKKLTNLAIVVKEYSPNIATDKPKIIYCPSFLQPASSRHAGEFGGVLVQMKISPEGYVIDGRVESSSGFSRLDEAAIKSFGRCAYIPKIINGSAVEDSVQLRTYWRADKKDSGDGGI